MLFAKSFFLSLIFSVNIILLHGQAQDSPNRWTISGDGSISWRIDNRLPHEDHIEMSGEKLSVILRYGVNADGSFHIQRTLTWPMLRFQPNKTRNHLQRSFDQDILKTIHVNEKSLTDEQVKEISFNGVMTVTSTFKPGIQVIRTVFPSPTRPVYIEEYQLKNVSGKPVSVEIPDYSSTNVTETEKAIYGQYTYIVKSAGGGYHQLDTGATLIFNTLIYALKEGEDIGELKIDRERKMRNDRVQQWWSELVLETPDEMLNKAFAFAKLRGSESIYRTKGGLFHGPGGGAYYAAIWANDQAEYIGPFFPFLGYDVGNEASLNAYRHFARFINPEYKAIPSSIISEGDNTWQGAKDRGDAAMVAYGASRFALSLGDKKVAGELWPLIEWTLEYCRRKVNDNGVVASDSDELEGRFPAGKANLCTSSLYYDALRSAVYLGKELNKTSGQLSQYTKQADNLKVAIEKHFGSAVEGFETYRYYDKSDLKGHAKHGKYADKEDVLRAWICMPLTVGIYDRKKGTIDALFSPRLWTADGLATEAGQETFWDRSTLYALRGVFAAGEKEKAMNFLKYYSNRRLLGEHVPYPVEAYPEGNQRHLSAESGLYCRIYTEGVFGIRPTGLRSFTLTPYLPNDWNSMALRKIHAFGNVFDLDVLNEKGKLRVVVTSNGKKIFNKVITEGSSVEVKL
jgi:hypothetical protein